MNRGQFLEVSKMAKEKAESMWQHVTAVCPDDHIVEHLAEARSIARNKGFRFNRIVWEESHYCFLNDDKPVAVIIRTEEKFDVYSDYKGS